MNKNYLLIVAACVIAMIPAIGQNTTPYSIYGYGILGDRATSMQRQMGGVGYAMNSGRQVNVMNPASYSATDSMTFLFDLGVDLTMLWQKEDAQRKYSTGGGVDYVTMQFPMGKHFGGSIGMLPVTTVGYAFGNDISHGTMENNGSGGINELYLGLSGKYKGFSIGFNIGYDFGNIVNDTYAEPTGLGRTKFEHLMEISDWSILIGAQYTVRLGKFSKMVAGITYSPKKTLLGKSRVTSQQLNLDDKPDTIGELNLKNNYYLPNIIGAGISYTYEKAYRVTAEIDFTWQGWKDCKYSPVYSLVKPNMVVFEGMTFNDRTRYAAGVEYIPKLRGSYMERVAYRMGGYYCKDYIKIGTNNLIEYGVTAGLGFPITEGKTIVNLGFEWKHRQATPQALVTENYFNITLGVNFNEVWFFKRRIK